MKNNKAITLIALIITVIVLLILAGVTINMVLGENGLFNKAKTSVGKYENAQEKENVVLVEYESEIDNARDTITISIDDLNKIIDEKIKTATKYSTEEQVVGTWIDGKPIYQKSYSGVTNNSSSTVIDNILGPQLKMIVSKDACIENNTSTPYSYLVSDGEYAEQTNYVGVLRSRDGSILISYGDPYKNKPYIVTIRYTKISD